MRFTFKNIFPRINYGNRPLVFTLAFLLVFSLGSYALAAGLYHPGDTNDPACSPGDAGCYVDIVPDQTGHTGYFLMTDGTNLSWSASIPGSGIATINADPSSAQTLTTGTSGTDFNIHNDLAGGHVFNLPTASALNRGLLSTSDWTAFNAKLSTVTVNAPLTGSGTSGSHLSIPVATGSADGYLSQSDWTTFNGKLSSVNDSNWSGTELSVGNGGTGATVFTDHGILLGQGTHPITAVPVGSDGQLLLGVTTSDPHFATLGGDATISNTGTLTIGAGAVTYSKIQNVAASSLLGNPTGSPASPSEITIGSGLSLTGSVLDVSAAPLIFSLPLSNTLGTVSIADAVADGITKGAATFVASDFNSSSGSISIDYTHGQEASATAKGFLNSTDWGTFNSKLTTVSNADWSGTQLSVAHGGTGDTTLAANSLLIGNGASAISSVSAGTNGQVLLGVTSGAPVFRDLGGDATISSTTGNLTLGTTGVTGTNCTLCNLTYDTKGRITVAASALSSDLTGLLGYTPLNPANNLSDVVDANTSLNHLLPTQTTNSGKFLQTNGTDTTWATAIGGGIFASQIAYGASTDNTIEGTNSFVYDKTAGLFNVGFGGNDYSYLKINHGNRTYKIGDINGAEGATLWNVDDSRKTLSATGYSGISSATVHHGSGIDDMVITGYYTGTLSTTFTLTIDGTNAQSLRYASASGTFTIGEMITGSTSGATGRLRSDDGRNLVIDSITGGTFIGGEVITGGTSLVTATVASATSGLRDTVSFIDGNSTNDFHHVVVNASLAFAYGMGATAGSTLGHPLGDSWTQDVTESAKTGLSVNFGSQVYALGDTVPGPNSAYVSVNEGSTGGGLITMHGNGGTCTFDGSPGVACLSDQRLKKNVTDAPSMLDQIAQLRPVTFNWIDPAMPQGSNIGFIAQEVQKIFPDFVSPVGDGTYLGVKYDGFIVPAIKSIQELNTKVQALSSIDISKDNSLASLITNFLKDAVVSIKEATIGTLHVGDQVCADDVCVTKEQFKNLLMQAGGASTPAPVSPAPVDPTPVAPTPVTPAPVVPPTPVDQSTPIVTPPASDSPTPSTDQAPTPAQPATVPATDTATQ